MTQQNRDDRTPVSPSAPAPRPPPRPRPPSSSAATTLSTAAVYGFVGYVTAYAAFGLFLAWALLPAEFLPVLPSKHWVLAVPAWVVMLWLYVDMVNYSIALIRAPPLDSTDAFYDEHSPPPPSLPSGARRGAKGGDEAAPGRGTATDQAAAGAAVKTKEGPAVSFDYVASSVCVATTATHGTLGRWHAILSRPSPRGSAGLSSTDCL